MYRHKKPVHFADEYTDAMRYGLLSDPAADKFVDEERARKVDHYVWFYQCPSHTGSLLNSTKDRGLMRRYIEQATGEPCTYLNQTFPAGRHRIRKKFRKEPDLF